MAVERTPSSTDVNPSVIYGGGEGEGGRETRGRRETRGGRETRRGKGGVFVVVYMLVVFNESRCSICPFYFFTDLGFGGLQEFFNPFPKVRVINCYL